MAYTTQLNNVQHIDAYNIDSPIYRAQTHEGRLEEAKYYLTTLTTEPHRAFPALTGRHLGLKDHSLHDTLFYAVSSDPGHQGTYYVRLGSDEFRMALAKRIFKTQLAIRELESKIKIKAGK